MQAQRIQDLALVVAEFVRPLLSSDLDDDTAALIAKRVQAEVERQLFWHAMRPKAQAELAKMMQEDAEIAAVEAADDVEGID